MTRDEFETAYAERSGITVSGLRAFGQHVVRCGTDLGCDDPRCEGWAMVQAGFTNHRGLPGFDENFDKVDIG